MLAICRAARIGPHDWPDSATPGERGAVLQRYAAIDNALGQLSLDRAIHAHPRALANAVAGPT